jgi:hypothetical protein
LIVVRVLAFAVAFVAGGVGILLFSAYVPVIRPDHAPHRVTAAVYIAASIIAAFVTTRFATARRCGLPSKRCCLAS